MSYISEIESILSPIHTITTAAQLQKEFLTNGYPLAVDEDMVTSLLNDVVINAANEAFRICEEQIAAEHSKTQAV